jgi:hypothetical protein
MLGVLAYVCVDPASEPTLVRFYPDPSAPEQMLLWSVVGLVLMLVLACRSRDWLAARTSRSTC